MKTQTENIPQMEDRELFRTILDASFTSMGEMLGQMAAWAEPYFPLGAAVEAVWLQATLVGVLVAACMYYRRDFTYPGTLLRRADSEAAATDATAAIGHRKATAVAHRAGELSLNVAGTLAGSYALASAFIGILNIYAWIFLGIGG